VFCFDLIAIVKSFFSSIEQWFSCYPQIDFEFIEQGNDFRFVSSRSSGLQTNWSVCPLGSAAFRVTINNTNTVTFRSISNPGVLLPLQFPLTLVSDVSSINVHRVWHEENWSWFLHVSSSLVEFNWHQDLSFLRFNQYRQCNINQSEHIVEPFLYNISNQWFVSIGDNRNISRSNPYWCIKKHQQYKSVSSIHVDDRRCQCFMSHA
jgi:hypothetical protein